MIYFLTNNQNSSSESERERMGKKKTIQSSSPSNTRNVSVSVSKALLLELLFVLGLAGSVWVAHNVYAINLISDPLQTLRLICMVETPMAILLYSLFRQNPKQCSYLKAVGRGVIALPIGALVIAFGAIMLGAPVGTQYLTRTLYWSLLMSVFTVVPVASVFGSTWEDWQRLFAHTKPAGALEYMICIPAHGAIIGSWIGAWPMPLDWERPWQEWPICVSYGTLAGYIAGVVVSIGFIFVCSGKQQHVKRE